MDYTEIARSAADKLLSYRKDPSGWKQCKKSVLRLPHLSPSLPHLQDFMVKGKVAVYWRPSSEFTGSLYKGEGIVPGKPVDVWQCLKPEPGGLRVKWDSNVDDFQLLESVTEDISVCRTVTPSAAMGIIAPRDFIDVVLIKSYEDGSIASNATNVEHQSCPPQQHFVRGFNHSCGCFCVPVPGEPEKTQVLSFFQTDLSGYLPKSVVESFFPYSMAQFYNNLAKAVKALHI